MATELEVIEQIPLPAVINPAQLPSLPAWVKRRSDALCNAVQPDSLGRHREIAVLPSSMILSSSERGMVEGAISGLGRLLSLDQRFFLRGQSLNNQEAIGGIILGLLLAGGGIKLDKTSADVMTDAYLDALEDLPAWTVREAIRKWNRGESVRIDKPHDFNWRPSPPILRRVSQQEMVPIKERISQLQKLLDALPSVEFSDDHREMMLKRLRVVISTANARS